MQQRLPWMVLFLLCAVAQTFPLRAQMPVRRPLGLPLSRPVESTEAQKAALNQIQGVGPIKFGVTVESFPKDILQPVTNRSTAPSDKWVYYLYAKPGDISWGTVHPKTVKLGFLGDQLVSIWFKLEEPLGKLVFVKKALTEKYGLASGQAQIAISEDSTMVVPFLNSERITLVTTLPEVPTRLDLVDLESPTTAVVEISDQSLIADQIRKATEAAEKKLREGDDLEKIKADL